MSDILGSFQWYELMTTDTEAAKAFYTEVVGWRTQPFEAGGMPYTMVVAGEEPIGGLCTLPEEAKAMGAPPHWLAYVGTPDVDATLATAQELGARVYFGPMDVPTVGRVAIIADPHGAVIGLYTPESGGMDHGEGLGKMAWHELMTGDVDAALGFYGTLFGWEKTESMDMGPEHGVYQMYGKGGKTHGGIMRAPQGFNPAWLYYVTVEDMAATLDRVKSHGGSVANGPMEVPGGGLAAQCVDPQGAFFALFSAPKG
ncbi:MAG: lactoylglutathione lyase [Myxococcales bacterium]